MTDLFRTVWPYLLVVGYVILAASVTLHAVIRKPETGTVIAWVGLAWLSPLIGAIAYFCFGVNRIQRKAVSLEIGEGLPPDCIPPILEEDYRIRNELIDLCPDLQACYNPCVP